MKRHELYPSKYLKAADLQGRAQTVVIDSLAQEEVGDDQKLKPVLSFRGRQKALVLNATNYDAIADAYGEETDDWGGQPIELYPTKVEFKGKRTDAIRIRIAPAPKPAAAPKPAPAADDMNDEIPF